MRICACVQKYVNECRARAMTKPVPTCVSLRGVLALDGFASHCDAGG